MNASHFFMIKKLLQLLLIFSVFISHTTLAKEFKVAVSIKPIHSLLVGLMEGVGSPELIIKDVDTPYTYSPPDNYAQQLRDYDLIFWVGPELEQSLEKPIVDSGDQSRVIELLSMPQLKVLPSRRHPNQRDPYFWNDTRNMLMLVDEVTRILVEADAPRAHAYVRNREKVFNQYAQLDREFEYGYRGLKGGITYLYYDTQQYFEQAYAMKVHDYLLSRPGEAVNTMKLFKARNAFQAGEIVCLLTEYAMNDEQRSILVGDAVINSAELDSFGTSLHAGSNLYEQLMRKNTQLIKQCMNHKPEVIAESDRITKADVDAKFILMNHLGEPVQDKDMLGKYQLNAYGYTGCPDICPTTLYSMGLVLNMLGDKADLLQPYFISVDPERDTVQVLGPYVKFFHKRIIGLTGSIKMIERAAKRYNVTYEKVPVEGVDYYHMNHTAGFDLIDPDGKFLIRIAHAIPAEEISRKILEHLH